MVESAAHDTSKAPPLKRRQRRRPAQYFVLAFNIVISIACFVTAALLIVGQQVINGTHKTEQLATPTITDPPIVIPTTDTESSTTDSASPDTAPPTTEAFPDADPNANNFLITGSDNGACNDPNSPTAVGERGTLGERSDTIMIMRVDPTNSRAAVLSFPRDLWVKIDGSNGRGRINSAYQVNDPQKLINTIANNFGILVNHYIQIDFCAFKTLVDSVGGVSVPFQFAARDRETGLDVPDPGCYTFNGSSALAYVRSRHYQWRDENGKYHEDGTSDYGRIARQQDFLRRAVAKVLSQGFNVNVANGLITVAQDYVVTDPELTLRKQLEFAGVLKNLDPADISTYRVEGVGTTIGGASVIEPRLNGDNMQAILAIFRGQAQLESAPEQVFESTTTSVPRTTTTTTVPRPTTSTQPSTSSGSSTGSSSTTTRPSSTTTTTTTTTTVPETTTTLPQVVVDQDVSKGGIVPPEGINCPS